MENQTKRFLVTDIDKALSQKASLFGLSSSEKLIKFLLLNNRKHVVNKIKIYLDRFNSQDFLPNSQSDETNVRNAQKAEFLTALIQTSKDVFKLPVLSRGCDIDGNPEPTEQYQARLEKFYQDNNFLADIHLMREYKILVSNVFNDFGYKSPEYKLFGDDRYVYPKSNIKKTDLSKSSELAKKLASFAADNADKSEDGFVYPYSYTTEDYGMESDLIPLDENDEKKLKTRKRKQILFYFSMFAGLVLGIGEAFAPATFYLSKFTALGLASIGLPIAGVAFFAALTVNAILMQGAVYSTFKDLFFKRRMTHDAKGNELKFKDKVSNFAILGLSAFAALTIATLSFLFSGFGAPIAAFISAFTFICFKSLLTNSVMKDINRESILSGLGFLKSLITGPLSSLMKARLNIFTKNGRKALFELAVNSLSAAAMIGFGATIVGASYVMFTSSILSLKSVTSMLGASAPYVVSAVVSLAEVTLGAFMVSNVCKCVNLVREFTLKLPETLSSAFKNLFNAKVKQPETSENYIQPELRKQREALGYIAGMKTVLYAFINAGGFAFGYLALFKSQLIGLASGLAYIMNSVTANAGGGLKLFLAGEGLHTYDEFSQARYDLDKKYQAAEQYSYKLPCSSPSYAVSNTDSASSTRNIITWRGGHDARSSDIISPITPQALNKSVQDGFGATSSRATI